MQFRSIFNSLLKDMVSITGFQLLIGLSQILLTPLFIKNWGSSYYGEYLLVFSLANFLSLGDFGLGTSAINEISRIRERNCYIRGKVTQDSAFILIALSSLVFLSLMFVSVFFIYRLDLVDFVLLKGDFVELLIYSFVGIWLNVGVMSLPLGLYKCIDKMYIERVSSMMFKLLEIVSVILVLENNGSAVLLIKITCGLRIANFIFLFIDLKTRGMDLLIKYKFRYSFIRSLLKPSMKLQ